MAKDAKGLVVIISLVLFMGCATGMKTERVEPGYSKQTYTTFSATDLTIVAERMAQSLVEHFDFGGQRPLVRVDTVKNKTDEHIDTKSITDSIITKIVNSGKVRFAVDYSERQDYEKRAAEEAFETRISEEDRQGYLSDQQAPRYRIYGELTNIKTITEDTKDVFFKFTLKMVDFKTGTLEWADETQLRKFAKKRVLGW
jgi:penicillin-binding protein activator